MRFLLDVGISPATAGFLRRQGHDAVHLVELGMGRLPDVGILDLAYREQRIVLTHDLDFGDLLAASGATLPSVVIFRLQDMRSANVSRHASIVVERHAENLSKGAVLSVSEQRVRVRLLPIER